MESAANLKWILAGTALALLFVAVPVKAQGLDGFLDSARRQIESTLRDASNRAMSDNQQNQTPPADATPIPAETPQKQAAVQNPVESTQDVIREFETTYLAYSDDEGYLPSSAIDLLAFAQKLAMALPPDYGISRECLRMRARNESRVAPSHAATQLVAIMKMIVDHQAPTTRPSRRVSSTQIKERVDWLAQPPGGCPRDIDGLKRFLSDFTDASKSMVAVRMKQVAAKRAEDERRQEAERAELARSQQHLQEARKSERMRQDEERRVRFEREQKRKLELTSGKAKPESYDDFRILLEPEDGQALFRTPSLNPGGKAVKLWGVLHRQEEDGVLLMLEPDLVLVRVGRNTKIIGDLRLRRVVNVIGRHNENAQYGNAFGASKTIAVVDAVVIHAND